jgi:hypothetical protein
MCIWVRYTERGISAKDAREKYVTGRLSKVEALIHTELAKPRPVPPAALKPAQRVRAKR